MKKEKNVLVTSLGYTKNHLHVEYYSAVDKNGEIKFCTGISGAEAGAKYVLANYDIDEIIVLGPATAEDKVGDVRLIDLDTFWLEESADISSSTEFEFFCYRLQQFLEHLDIEAHDILNYADPETNRRLSNFMEKELAKGRDGSFYLAVTEESAYRRFLEATKKLHSKDEIRWLKHMMYHDMDSYFKLRALRSNRTMPVRYVAMEKLKGGSFSVESMGRAVDYLATHFRDGVNLYVDLQGMDKADSYTMNAMLSLAYNAEQKLNIKCMIHTRSVADSFVNSIDDEVARYDFETLLAGMRAFTKYGKAEVLEEYCISHHIKDTTILDMIKAMKYVDTGVSLCNLEDLKYGIQALKKIFRKDVDESSEASIFNTVKRGVQHDYGPLLEGEEISIPELISWALRKHFYQQALTMIESLVPVDLVKRGILYYAETAADIDDVLSRWNVAYWNEIPKCRYVFKKPDHYFIKSYGRMAINNGQAPQNVYKDLARTMVEQQKGANDKLCRTFSCLNDDALLYELLLSYYTVGSLRNRVSHADSTGNALNNQEELQENESFAILKKQISRFLKIYQSACLRAEELSVKPLRITENEFRFYTRQHRLQPISDYDPEDIMENSYQCQYNGKELIITIKMLKPEEE